MFYTIRSSSDEYIQSIGMAESDDLYTWRKFRGNPVITPDGRRYNTPEYPAANGLVCCRDLMTVKHNSRPGVFGVFATRLVTRELQEGPVFAGAYSEDMVSWEQTAPVFQPPAGKYTIVEMPDLFYFGGKWVLTWLEDNLYGNREIMGNFYDTCGTVYALSDKFEGPYTEPDDNMLLCSMGYNGFSCRSVEYKGKRYVLYARGERMFENEQKPTFGSLSSPKELRFIGDKLCLCYADLIEENVTASFDFTRSAPERLAYNIYYENRGDWSVENGTVTGGTDYSWSRFCFLPQARDFIFDASVTALSCVAAGLCIRQYCDNRNELTGIAIFFDIRRQVIAAASLPRFQLCDMRPFKCADGNTVRLKVIATGQFIEVYTDEILQLQFITHVGAERGPLGLLTDRGHAAFSNVSVRMLAD